MKMSSTPVPSGPPNPGRFLQGHWPSVHDGSQEMLGLLAVEGSSAGGEINLATRGKARQAWGFLHRRCYLTLTPTMASWVRSPAPHKLGGWYPALRWWRQESERFYPQQHSKFEASMTYRRPWGVLTK